jgi:hypothetical protein
MAYTQLLESDNRRKLVGMILTMNQSQNKHGKIPGRITVKLTLSDYHFQKPMGMRNIRYHQKEFQWYLI